MLKYNLKTRNVPTQRDKDGGSSNCSAAKKWKDTKNVLTPGLPPLKFSEQSGGHFQVEVFVFVGETRERRGAGKRIIYLNKAGGSRLFHLGL